MKKFQNDLVKLDRLIQAQEAQVANLYKALDDPDHHFRAELIRLCKSLDIEPKRAHFFALIDRIVNLKVGGIVQILKSCDKSESQILESKYFLLGFVQDFYHSRHFKLLQDIETTGLLTPFYRALLFGVHNVGLQMSAFFTQWSKKFIDGTNEELRAKFKDDVFAKLIPTIDKESKNGKLITSDRSYSIAVLCGERIKILPFCVVFEKEILSIAQALTQLIDSLCVDDEIYNAKSAYVEYFTALREAFLQADTDKLISSWQEVDRKWMCITTPFQVGHPLEYYEDCLRHCVAPEWDLRFAYSHFTQSSDVYKNVCALFSDMCEDLLRENNTKNSDKENNHKKENKQNLSRIMAGIRANVIASLQKVRFYIGTPILYYGADLDGLFSAQVVPNDEEVSKEFGKKIFAFPDRILRSSRAKPKMRLHYEVFEREFLQKMREILFDDENLWFRIYDISTNGHELGHILWIDDETQSAMNTSGEFKNIEEFKATSGGLVAYFHQMDKAQSVAGDELSALMGDTIARAVFLMAWREQEEVRPYYCEGLIHLYGAFSTNVLEFNPQNSPCLKVNTQFYDNLKLWYQRTYESLVRHYIDKKDAKDWLYLFVRKNDKTYTSAHKIVCEFVEWYWQRYCQIGQEILQENA